MVLSDLCIRRPVLATVISLVVVLLGIVCYQRLSVREYPKIDEPVVTVETKYRGASAEIIESRVTKVLEDSLAGIEGVDVLTSISRAENSQITVRFRLERNPDAAASDVRFGSKAKATRQTPSSASNLSSFMFAWREPFRVSTRGLPSSGPNCSSNLA